MADNTPLNAGSGGDTISTDDIGGGVKVQRVKAQHGADGSATDVSVSSGLPIQGANRPSYASAVSITCTMASKTSGQGRRSAAVDNSSNQYTDALVFVSLTPGTITAPASFAVYAYGSYDGTNYDTGGSSDADYNTLAGDEAQKLLGVVAITANTTARGQWFSVANAFGGTLPRNWGIIIVQTNCGTLSATEGNHVKQYVGVRGTLAGQ